MGLVSGKIFVIRKKSFLIIYSDIFIHQDFLIKNVAIDTFNDYLKYTDFPMPRFELLDKIVEDSNDFPIECIDIIYDLIDKNKDIWLYSTWEKSLYIILENGIKTENQKTIDKAEEIIDKLGRLGGNYLKFGELLK